MAELKTQLDLQQIPKIVGEDGTQLLARCYAVLEHTRWPLYIVGPSGSGKSIIAMNLARQYALAKNVPAYYVQLSPEQTKTRWRICESSLRLWRQKHMGKSGLWILLM